MGKEAEYDGLTVIANLLALQLSKDMSAIDATWLLKKSGMRNANIAQVLDIPEGSVRKNISLKKQHKKPANIKSRKKKNDE